jgi:hypothetical protein
MTKKHLEDTESKVEVENRSQGLPGLKDIEPLFHL